MSTRSILRFFICGSIDDGKSTLLGRLLFDSKSLSEEKIQSLQSQKEIDFSSLSDGLLSEKEQGITIDVAYKFFSSNKRHFIAIDTPGHEQYTKNMAVAASQANLALVVIDINNKNYQQTKKHINICSIFNVNHAIIIINKMDQVDYSEKHYNELKVYWMQYFKSFSFQSIDFIPVSAIKGDNIVDKSSVMDWYKGQTLLDILENINPKDLHPTEEDFLFPVQNIVNRQGKRLLYGNLIKGKLAVGDTIKVYPSNEINSVISIYQGFDKVEDISAGSPICLALDKQMDISRGDFLSTSNSSENLSDSFRSKILWIGEENLIPGRQFEFKFAHKRVKGSVLKIKGVTDVDTSKDLYSKVIQRNEIGNVDLSLNQKVLHRSYEKDKFLGSFLIIDIQTKDTVGVGLIQYPLRRSENTFVHNFEIDKNLRASQKGQKACVVWLTGLSGAGKSTIANALEKMLFYHGKHVYTLDGDNVRKHLCKDLGFEEVDRIENIRRVGEVAKLMTDAGLIVICSFISPYQSDRDKVRELFSENEFIEVFVDAPLNECIKRDPKGLYKKALNEQIPNFTGITSVYEKPDAPELTIDSMKLQPEEAAEKIYKILSQ